MRRVGIRRRAQLIEPGTNAPFIQVRRDGFRPALPALTLGLAANSAIPAAREGVRLGAGLRDIKVGSDDSAFSAVERLFTIVNGPVNVEPNVTHPQRRVSV